MTVGLLELAIERGDESLSHHGTAEVTGTVRYGVGVVDLTQSFIHSSFLLHLICLLSLSWYRMSSPTAKFKCHKNV